MGSSAATVVNKRQQKDLHSVIDQANQKPEPGSVYEGLTPGQYAVCLHITKRVKEAYELKASYEDANAIQSIELYTILSAIDKRWQEHLYHMDSLRSSIGLRAYGQRDPLLEYKAEAFKMFDELMVQIKSEICHNIFRSASSLMAFENFLRNLPKNTVHQSTTAFGGQSARSSAGKPADRTAPAGSGSASGSSLVSEANQAIAAATAKKATPVRTGPKVSRNDPCPCGSGKKYKQCCGR
jgi:preprotein translocase subunit SecA